MKSIFSWPLSALILGAYPVLYTYSVNLGSINATAIIAPLVIAMIAAALLNCICAIGMRGWSKGALVADIILFSSYLSNNLVETLFPWINGSPLSKPVAGAQITLILAGAWAIGHRLKRASNLPRWTAAANVCSLMLMAIPLLQIGWFHWTLTPQPLSAGKPPEEKTLSHARPSVYYIILDGYAREDVLARDLGYDNSRFIHFLKRNGFYVARRSRSNYAYTYLSLASSLNMDYLSELNAAPDQEQECIRRIYANTVMRIFRANGYRIVRYSPSWLSQGQDRYSETTFNARAIDEFENLVLKQFLIRPFMKHGVINMYRVRTLYTLHRLEAIARDPRPSFVFAHILCPHPPYVFDRKGNMPEPKIFEHRPAGSHDWYPGERYTDQVDYLNHLMEKTISAILKNSKIPPLIIIQGDHGAACDGTSDHPSPLMVRERMCILNAYYVPIELRSKLYASITPVNTFRLVGDYLFHDHFTRLPDHSYYSGPMDDLPYEFVDMKRLLPEGQL
jgi:hypothetical protein